MNSFYTIKITDNNLAGNFLKVQVEPTGNIDKWSTTTFVVGSTPNYYECEIGSSISDTIINLKNQLDNYYIGAGEPNPVYNTTIISPDTLKVELIEPVIVFEVFLLSGLENNAILNVFSGNKEKVNTKAPYYVYYSESLLEGVAMDLYVYTGATFDVPTSPTQQLFSTAINESVTFEISEIIDGFIEDNFNGDYESNNVWVRYITTNTVNGSDVAGDTVDLIAYEGFPYATDGANAQLDSVVMQSNDIIIANDYDAINIPIDANTYDVTVNYYSNSHIAFTETLSAIDDSDSVIQYSSNSVGDYDAFRSRVELDGGLVQNGDCIKPVYDDYYSTMDVDYVSVSYNGLEETITVKEIEECKYTSHKVVFKNKFGAWQDLWFFKRSDLSLNTKAETYKSNVITQGVYNISDHQKKIYRKNGQENLKLNTGFYPESYNEVFTQLSLSEQVYIEYNDQTLPINVKTSNITFKNNVNDKLINYSIEVEFAFDKINSRR